MNIRAVSYLISHAAYNMVLKVPVDENVVQAVRIGLAGHRERLCEKYWSHIQRGTSFTSRTGLALLCLSSGELENG